MGRLLMKGGPELPGLPERRMKLDIFFNVYEP
jgi:hypothetical protein